MPSFLSPALKAPGERYQLVVERTGQALVAELELAVDSATRRKGLLGRDGLAPGAGLVIAPSNAVHTFFMRFPIDIVFLTRAGNVLKVRQGVGPRRLTGVFRGFAVLEMAEGSAGRLGLVVGDRLILRPGVEA
jgi:uncharacterized protein